MSIVDASTLQLYMETYGKHRRLVDVAMKHISPLMVMADEGPDLARADNLDTQQVATAISRAIGRRVRSVRMVSLREMTWDTQTMHSAVEEMRANRSTDLENCVRDKVRNHLWYAFGAKKHNSSADERMIDHIDTLMSALTIPFKWSLRKEVERQLCAPMNRDVWNMELLVGGGVEQVIWDYLGYAVLGHSRRAAKFEPLIKLFPKTIPLYEETDNLGNWVTLTA